MGYPMMYEMGVISPDVPWAFNLGHVWRICSAREGGGHNFLKETKRGAKSVGGEKNQFDQIFKGV